MGVLGLCLKICGWFPVVFITAVILWSYYAYVVELCILILIDTSVPLMLAYLVFYHVFLVMFLWAYWKTLWTPVAKVPQEFYLTSSELQQYEAEDRSEEKSELLKGFARDKGLPVLTRTYGGGLRYCPVCKIIKPDRCHHCSICNICILKMDHHCPWVNNCVCYSNYKFFVLFLFYTIIFCLYVALTVLPFFIQFWEGELGERAIRKFQIVFLFFAAVMFGLSVLILMGMHLHLTLTNRSTLESFRAPVFRHGPDKDGFNRGSFCNNFKEVFGDDKRQWLLPVFSAKGDGISFPVQARDQDSDRLLDGEVESDVGSGRELDDKPADKGGIRESIKTSPTYSTMSDGGASDQVTLQIGQNEGAQVNLAIERDTQ